MLCLCLIELTNTIQEIESTISLRETWGQLSRVIYESYESLALSSPLVCSRPIQLTLSLMCAFNEDQ